MSIFEFFSRDAGRKRREYLEDVVGGAIESFIPPNLRPAAEFVSQANPVVGMGNAMSESRIVFDPEQTVEARKRAALNMGTEMAIALTPAALARLGYMTAPVALAETFATPAAEGAKEAARGLMSDVQYAARSATEGDLPGIMQAFTPSREPVGAVNAQITGADVANTAGSGMLFRGQSPVPGTEKQLERAIEEVPELENVLPYLTPEEAATITFRSAPNLEAAFRATNPSDLVGAAVGGQGKLGWYKESANALSTVFGDDMRRFSTLLAAMSPQTSVEMNLENAVRTWANWVKAGRPKDPNEILDIMGRSVLGDKGSDSVLDAWKNNSIRALSAAEGTPGDDFRLSGPKVDSFGFATSGDLDRFTNDAWQANLTGVPQALFARSSGKSLPGYSAGYLGSSAAGRKAAEQMSNILGEEIMPSEVQETAWSFGKALYEQMAEGMPQGGPSALQIYQEGLLSPERITDVPDFASLLQQERYGGPLRELGYGTNIDEAARAAQRIGTRDISAAGGVEGAEAVARRLDALYQHRQFVSETAPFRNGSFSASRTNGSRSGLVLPYGEPSGRLVPLSFGASGKALAPTSEFSQLLSKRNTNAPEFYKLGAEAKNRTAFVNTMKNNQASRGIIGKSVDIYSANQYKGYKLFNTSDGKAGFAIAPDGELASVVAEKGSHGGFSDAALSAAVQNGAKWLNAYDTVLPGKYAKFGFKPVARLRFDENILKNDIGEKDAEEFMKTLKGFNNGKPDLVFMVFDPNFSDTVANNVGGRFAKDYDEAMKFVQQAIDRLEK